MQQLVVEVGAVRQLAVLLELLAVVGGHDDDGRVAHAERREPVEESLQLEVPEADAAVVEVAEVLHLGGGERRRTRPVAAIIDQRLTLAPGMSLHIPESAQPARRRHHERPADYGRPSPASFARCVTKVRAPSRRRG